MTTTSAAAHVRKDQAPAAGRRGPAPADPPMDRAPSREVPEAAVLQAPAPMARMRASPVAVAPRARAVTPAVLEAQRRVARVGRAGPKAVWTWPTALWPSS